MSVFDYLSNFYVTNRNIIATITSSNTNIDLILDVDCGIPEEIENGSFMLPSNVTYYGSAVLYECKPGYRLDGHDRRLCLENGTWNSDPPKCLGKDY